MFNANFRVARPRVIVFGNEKGGTGKSTLVMHLAIALLNRGMTVATLDLDAEQRSLSRYIANRRRYRTRTQTELAVPTHLGLGTEQGQIGEVEVANAIDYFRGHDAIIIDTPGYFTTLAQAGPLGSRPGQPVACRRAPGTAQSRRLRRRRSAPGGLTSKSKSPAGGCRRAIASRHVVGD